MITWFVLGFFLNLLATYMLARHDMDYGQVFCCALLSFAGPILFALFLIFYIGMSLNHIPVFKDKKK